MTDAPKHRFYGRRKGRPLRPTRQSLLDTMLPALSMPEGEGPFEPASLFDPAPREVWLEIGFGNGEHLVWQADANPDVGIIGAEPFLSGVGRLLSYLDERPRPNVRIHADDVRPLLDRLTPGSLSRVFILFADPWPKTRHHERRIVSTATLDRLAVLMRDGAELRLATDDMGYLRWMLEHTLRHPAFEWTARRPGDWRERPADWPPTRYEQKAITGRKPIYLSFVRRPR
ncbi:tRNA (guanine-N7-)-methyltransferase [Constrictibacter sp. MBR-5]|jgi:tRNA (guanine-N7-)-methyltransferase|uniref:tRNA (guanine(46)-N(7))-methyltransferase TrmB n=1 Tax=Constrictibacter sp. MBR-5 TaxID=3156467 RepID=UPI003390E79C